MGKKYKIYQQNILQNIQKGTQGNVKLSKRQKRKIRMQKKQKQMNQINVQQLDQQQNKNNNNIIEQQQYQSIEDNEIQNQNSQDNDQAIQIQSNDQQYINNTLQFNQKGKQGFEDLMNITNEKQINNKNYKFLKYKKEQSNQIIDSFIYQIKKDTYYKVISINHDKMNLTHLNELINVQICSQFIKFIEKNNNQYAFLVNGKIYEQNIQFMKANVFKIIKNNNKKQMKQSNQKEKKQINIKINIQQIIKKCFYPHNQQNKQQLIDFLRDFDSNQDILLMSKQQLVFLQTSQPFLNLNQNILKNNNSLLILGKKNSGKSTLAEYIKNLNPKQVCILECDIGRSLIISGCVSLITPQQNFNIWIGQFTPFNCIKLYLKAIKILYFKYREKHFSKKLIINTMGYLNGLGQMIIYEIYHLVNPSQIITIHFREQLETQNQFLDGNLSNILKNIQTGNYMNKLVSQSGNISIKKSQKFNKKKQSLEIYKLFNQHAQSKGIPIRFQNLICYKKSIKNIIQLIDSIHRNQLENISKVQINIQDKLGVVNPIKIKSQMNMRIVLIGEQYTINQQINQIKKLNISSLQQNQSFKLFRIYGVGFGFKEDIYYDRNQIQNVLSPNLNLNERKTKLKGLINQGVDFEKNFYQLNQRSLIEFQLQYQDIPFILPIIKGLGSKGVRNNPSKSI